MTKFDPKIHHRRSTRLEGYDYSQAGAYFVTVVTWQRKNLFGNIVDGEIVLDVYGEIIQKWWDDIPVHFPNVETGAFVIMPNHIHGIVVIGDTRRSAVLAPDVGVQNSTGGGGTPPLPGRKPTLGQVVAYFKYQSTKEMNSLAGNGVTTKFWQRNYHDRVIRNEGEMSRIWDYIESNPAWWETDPEK